MATVHAPNTFLDLPRELRDLIYTHCSPLPNPPHSPNESQKTPPSILGRATALLRASKQVHSEAAPIFYGNKPFTFFIGWRREWSETHHYWMRKKYIDTSTRIAVPYLRMIKSCTLFIDPYVSEERHTFLAIKTRVHDFAIRLSPPSSPSQCLHSLLSLHVILDNYAKIALASTLPSSPQHLLEPLAQIYGVPDITVDGVNIEDEYKARLERAIGASRLTVRMKEAAEVSRKVRARGKARKVMKMVKVGEGRYDGEKVVWDVDVDGIEEERVEGAKRGWAEDVILRRAKRARVQ